MSSKYRESGVDIDAAGKALDSAGGMIRKTWGASVLSETGNFGGLFRMPEGYDEPVLVSSVDGVGTKLKVAFLSGKHDTVGEDLVNHCVNDILVQGAKPLFFLDYIGCGKLEPKIVTEIIKGFSRGCQNNGCALIGGETAEMPGFYKKGEYDLAGCIVGIVEKKRIIDGGRIEAGDEVWALPSGGLHTNGYSLARKVVFKDQGLGVEDTLPGGPITAGEELLKVHRSYLKEVEELQCCVDIKGLAHITGGGLVENIPRILPKGTAVQIETGSWEIPAVFRFLMEWGGISREEMYRVFNMGIGMAVIISPGDGKKMKSVQKLRWNPFHIGRVTTGGGKVILS